MADLARIPAAPPSGPERPPQRGRREIVGGVICQGRGVASVQGGVSGRLFSLRGDLWNLSFAPFFAAWCIPSQTKPETKTQSHTEEKTGDEAGRLAHVVSLRQKAPGFFWAPDCKLGSVALALLDQVPSALR